MRVLAIVPARAGSTRLPGKNVMPLGGVPLAERALRTALAADRVDRVVVSSDDDAVLDLAAAVDPDVALRRPPELAGDRSPALDFVLHALDALAPDSFDAVAIVQPTSPFTSAADVDATIGLLDATGAESAVTVMALDHAIHPAKLKTMDGDRLEPYLEDERGRMAAHELPEVFVRNCSVYVSRTDVYRGGRTLGDDCRGHVMPRLRSADINDATDFAFAEFILDRHPEIDPLRP